MLSIFIIQLPFSVCAVWCLFTLLKGNKTYSDRLLAVLMALLTIGFLCGSNHMSPYPNYKRLVIIDIIMQFTTISVFPFIYYYIRSLFDEEKIGFTAYLLLLPSILLTTAAVVVTVLLGIDHSSKLIQLVYGGAISLNLLDVTERAYVILTYKGYHFVFFVSLVISIVYVFSRLFVGRFKFAHIPAFLRGQKTSFVANVVCLFFVIFMVLWGICIIFNTVFMNSLSIWSSIWAVFTSLLLFLIGYVGAVPSLPGGYIDIDRLRHPFNAMRQSRQEYLQGINSGPVADVPLSGYDKIMDSFKKVMVTDQGFLEPNMSIDEISQRLITNRTYVSKLVNIYYGMPFRDYLNKLRLDYSKELMAAEPDAVIDYIAAKSGFQSSTQFIRKFRETEGITPTAWKTLQRHK